MTAGTGAGGARLLRACTATPLRVAATAAVITPGMHLLLSTLVERRRMTWSTEYPAVTVGDPLLAVAAGLATHAAGVDAVLRSPMLRRPLAPVLVGGGVLFGAWQLRDELRRGVYSRQQAFSPSKLWHQFVVYPTLAPLVSGSVLTAVAAATAPGAGRGRRVAAGLALAGVAGWGLLAIEAIRNPSQGHGSFDWRRRCGRPPRVSETGGSAGPGAGRR